MTRDEAALVSAHARAEPFAALVRGSLPARAWLGVAPRISEDAPPAVAPITLDADPIVAVLFEDATGARAALELDPLVATVLVERTLGGEAQELEGVTGPLRDLERGVLAYAFGRWLAGTGSAFGVAAVLSTSAALARALGEAARVRRSLTLHVGGARGRAVLWMPELARPARRHLPRWAGRLPIEVVISGGHALLSARDLASLQRGDIVVPDRCELSLREGSLAGMGRLDVRGTTQAWRVRVESARLEIVERELGGAATHGALTTERQRDAARETMNAKHADRRIDELGETPVTLTLELARLVLPLEELARLAPGEIVRTGAQIGERVSLRAGDRIVATGELVDVEGEVGLRILELPER